jgi:hypothetical protein
MIHGPLFPNIADSPKNRDEEFENHINPQRPAPLHQTASSEGQSPDVLAGNAVVVGEKSRGLRADDGRCLACGWLLSGRKAGLVCKNWKCKNFWKYGRGPVQLVK